MESAGESDFSATKIHHNNLHATAFNRLHTTAMKFHGERRIFMENRSIRNVGFESRWHESRLVNQIASLLVPMGVGTPHDYERAKGNIEISQIDIVDGFRIISM